jgi:type II secretory pathway pseudopilin PulG
MRQRIAGFSLVELGIVLAVIALIVTAMLMAGDTVFGRSGLVSLLSNIKDLATASREFKARYSYFPGDIPSAQTAVNGGISAGCSYNVGGTTGNGLVDTQVESDCAFEHLVKAGILKKIDYDNSTNKYFIAVNIGDGARLSLWFKSDSLENVIKIAGVPGRPGGLPCDVALELDRKLDNIITAGKPFKHDPGAVVVAEDTAIETCVSQKDHDPVPALLIRY